MRQEIHVNDIGTVFRVTLKDGDDPVSVADATSKFIIFRNPGGQYIQKTAALYTDGTDGVIQYTTTSGDLSIVGHWEYQARVVKPSGTWSSTIHEFRVYPNLDTI